MRYLIAVIITALAPFAAETQTCSVASDSVSCDNGLSANKIGEVFFWSDGIISPAIGGMPFRFDTTTNSGGNDQFGDTSPSSDEKTCKRTGDSIFCDYSPARDR